MPVEGIRQDVKANPRSRSTTATAPANASIHLNLRMFINFYHLITLFSDEFGRLGKNFNQMLERIQKLISQIYEEQKKLKNSELKALQAQIQPHFLYNSLDSAHTYLRAIHTLPKCCCTIAKHLAWH